MLRSTSFGSSEQTQVEEEVRLCRVVFFVDEEALLQSLAVEPRLTARTPKELELAVQYLFAMQDRWSPRRRVVYRLRSWDQAGDVRFWPTSPWRTPAACRIERHFPPARGAVG